MGEKLHCTIWAAALDLSGALIRNFSPLTITFINSQGGTLQRELYQQLRQ